MVIAVASGKGGTGKTTVSAALALALSAEGPVSFLDCDVEEPNAGIFLSAEKPDEQPVEVSVPAVDAEKCTGCGACASFCRFNALAMVRGKVLVFPELCHGCGGCTLVCPSQAITERGERIGVIRRGMVGSISFADGCLDVGRAMSPPLIRALKKGIRRSGLTIIDSPPGTSCPMVTAVKGADYVLLVTEPTPFGLHDLKLAVLTMRETEIPFGVIINRSDAGDDRVVRWCDEQNIRILMQIPEDRRVAEAYSRGKTILDADGSYRERFTGLLRVLESASYGGGQ